MQPALLEIELAPTMHRNQRIPQLDSLRGMLLLWMTLTHLPTRVSAYSNQVVGYVSAAEGFVLMAAVLTSHIHRRADEKYGSALAHRSLLQRALRIYRYHLVLLGVAFGLCGAAAVYLNRVPLQYLLDFFITNPKTALAAAPLLLYNPPLLDILPIYIIFMLLTPVFLWAARKCGWTFVLIGSTCVWLLAQCDLRGWIYSAMAHAGFPIPLNEMGAFDVFGWQFLWIGGLALGEARLPTRWPRLLLTVSATLAVVLFVCRHAAFDKLTGPALFDLLVDKWKLGVLRLVNLAALGILLVRFGVPLANSRLGMRMAVLGRASLEVFSAHLICCFVFVGIGDGPDVHFTVSQDVAIVSITITFMFVVAERVKRRRNAGADRASSAMVLTDITRWRRGRSAA